MKIASEKKIIGEIKATAAWKYHLRKQWLRRWKHNRMARKTRKAQRRAS